MYRDFFHRIRNLFSLGKDKLSEQKVIESITDDVDFHGVKLWLLILATFVASLGLNTNSTAVIIGAMLISPLMGPIIGMGLGVGIYDFTLFKRSFANFARAAVFSIITATVYFLLAPPVSQTQSELLARTSPTIYDVGIALCGGLAGILAVSSRSQRYGNVIPGVAIATALMPPLCTVGYGISRLNLTFVAGALYLFLINTVFIAFSTAICVAFILRIHPKVHVDAARERKVKRIIVGIILLTMVPSIFLTMGIVRSTIFDQHVAQFVQQEMHFPNTRVVHYHANHVDKSLQVFLLGERLDSAAVHQLEASLGSHKLHDVSLQVIQGESELQQFDISSILSEQEMESLSAAINFWQTYSQEDHQRPTQNLQQTSHGVVPEIKALFPQVEHAYLTTEIMLQDSDSVATQEPLPVVILEARSPLAEEEQSKLRMWLSQRFGVDSLIIKTLFPQ